MQSNWKKGCMNFWWKRCVDIPYFVKNTTCSLSLASNVNKNSWKPRIILICGEIFSPSVYELIKSILVGSQFSGRFCKLLKNLRQAGSKNRPISSKIILVLKSIKDFLLQDFRAIHKIDMSRWRITANHFSKICL